MIVAEDLRGIPGPDSAPSKIGLDSDLRSGPKILEGWIE